MLPLSNSPLIASTAFRSPLPLALVLGAIVSITLLGAVGYSILGFYALAVPIVLVAGLATRVRPHTVPA